jgi:hypothetical protein
MYNICLKLIWNENVAYHIVGIRLGSEVSEYIQTYCIGTKAYKWL